MKVLKGALLGLCLSLPTVAAAGSYTYTMEVVSSSYSSTAALNGYSQPDVGTIGSVTLTLDGATLDADPTVAVDMDAAPLDTSLTSASASFPGTNALTASLSAPNWFSFPSGGSGPAGARISNGSFSSLVPTITGVNCATLGCTFAGSFSVRNASASQPTTFAEIEALLADPTSLIRFSFNGTVTGDYAEFVATSVTPAVPLPASALLLMGAVAALGARRRS